jgi:cobalt-zinc-cadmium efflux system membrane fusion protein
MSAELKGLVSQLAKSKEELAHEQALAALAARDAWAKLEAARQREAQAAADVARLRPLEESGALSPEEMRRYEQKHLELVHAREETEVAARKADVAAVGGQGAKAADYEGVMAHHAQVAREVESLETDLARLVLKAPIAGVVTYPEFALRMASKEKRKAKVGDEAVPWRPFVEIADLAKIEVRTQVPERRVGEIAVGAPARVSIDAGGGPTMTGRVARVESLAVPRADAQATSFVAASETRAEKVFEVSIELTERPERLKPGMSVTVDLVVKKLAPSTFVPLAAIFEDGEGKVAFVVSGARVEPRPVELGASRQDAVVVTKGLAAGEQVLLQDPRSPQRASR